jgi:ubiquinone/menaquinone biosynthesis C-methylase UbiE
MGNPYFVRDHRKATRNFLAAFPLDQAMARSVGPHSVQEHDRIARVQLEMLQEFGLRTGHCLIDVGCGCGGLASQLAISYGPSISYLGTDVVPELIAFTRGRTPASYRLEVVTECRIPAAAESADFLTAFSVFTHLRRPHIDEYLRESFRVLRPGGKLVFSYLEPWRHWKILGYTVAVTLLHRRKIENHFTSEWAIRRWAERTRFAVERICPGRIGQSVAVLVRS